MFIASSLEYQLKGFDSNSKMWEFERLPDAHNTRQVTFINKAKFIDKASGLVYFLDEEGTKTLTFRSRARA